LNLEWLSANLPHAQQLYILRHPCGQFESWQRLGWEPRLESLLENPRLVADHLHPFQDLIRSARGFWERVGAYWGATMYVVHRQSEGGARRRLVAYEWLCEAPIPRFQELYSELRLTWNPNVERFIRQSNDDRDRRHSSLRRVASTQIDAWKGRLLPHQIEACRRFVEPFGLPYYPDFEPYVANAHGSVRMESTSSA
jgi:hypothetical protein